MLMIGELLASLASRGIHLWVEGSSLRYSAPDVTSIDESLRDAIRQRRDELLEVLSKTEALTPPSPIVKAPSDAEVRCSHAQECFLFSALLDGSSDPYRLDAAFRIVGALDVRALASSIQDIVKRQQVLHTCFQERPGGGFVIRQTDWLPELQVVDFTGDEAELLKAMSLQRVAEFDLMRGPHLAATLYRLSGERHVLNVLIHHIVSDGASIPLFARELQACYAWRSGVAPKAPADPAMQFRDVAYSERVAAHDDEGRLLSFWKQDLEGAPSLLALPTDRPRPTVRTADGGSVSLQIGPALLQRLQHVKNTWRVSEFQILTAALWLMLHKYSGQAAVVIGTPWRNRDRPGSEQVIGPLLNLLPLHIRPADDATVGGLLIEVKNRTLAAMEHGSVPFERIVSHLRPERSTAYSPIFQVLCAIDTTPVDAVTLPKLRIEPLELPNEAARYDLAIVMQQTAGSLRGSLKFSRALFDDATAQRMTDHFVSALELVLNAPATPIARAQLMRAPEQERLLVDWNRTERPYNLQKTLVELFQDRVAAGPDRIALEHDGCSLSYGALNHWANIIAQRLVQAGVVSGDVVGITLDRSVELVVAILAVVKAGAAYLAIDGQHPVERRDWMLQNAAVSAVIGVCSVAVPRVDVGTAQEQQAKVRNPERSPHPDSACYVIYTSGSTGVPKGVVVSHRAITNNVLWMNDEWPLAERDAVLFKSSPGFDVSVKEIFWPLIAGVRLVVAPAGASGDPAQLCRIITESRISVVHMVPTMLDFFLRHESASQAAPHLRIVMCGGEALSPGLRARFHHAFPSVLLHMYGPTEAAIAVTGYAIAPEHDEVARLPLGRPMPNCRIYVASPRLEPVPVGVAGELCIAGTPLARGYVGRPDLTAEKFVPDPFSGVPGARMYLTGDSARWRPDSQVEYLGRIDRQVKLNGLRIEPGEIEAQIRALPAIDDALVVVRQVGGNNALVGYVATQSRELSAEDIQRALRIRLPVFMVPARLVIMPAFPMNVNGKVDLAALPQPEAVAGADSGSSLVASAGNLPQGDLEEAIAQIWCEVLNLTTIDRDDEFFDLGGHSLLILELQARLRDDLSHTVAVADLFLHPTVASLAAHLSEANGSTRGWLKKIMRFGRGSAS